MHTLSINKPIAEINGKQGVIDKRIGVAIEPCLVTYGVKLYVGNEEEGRHVKGFIIEGKNEEYITTAVRNCIQFILHRRPEIEEEKIYELTTNKNEGDINEEQELFEEI